VSDKKRNSALRHTVLESRQAFTVSALSEKMHHRLSSQAVAGIA